jgi:hypothetical protein
MTASKHEQEALREILRRAHQQKEKVELSGQWRQEVMGRIRTVGPVEEKPSFLSMFEQLVWRFAPVACLLILGLTLLLSSVSFTPEDEAVRLLMNGTEELTLVQFLEL